MVQIIDNSPDAATLRQRALNNPFNQIASGIDEISSAYQQGQKTKRQQALEQQIADQSTMLKLAEQGIDASPQDLRDFANGTYKAKVIEPGQDAIPAQYGKELQGPVMPGQSSLKEILTPAQEAVAPTYGPSNPLLNFTESRKQKEKEAAAKLIRDEKRANLEEDNIRDQMKERSRSQTFKEQSDQRDYNLKKEELALKGKEYDKKLNPEPRERLSKLSAEAQGKVGSIASGIQALYGIGNAVSAGDKPSYVDANTPILGNFVSDTDFTAQQRILDEVIGRLQSGGAIGVPEGKNFKAMGPRPGDSPEQISRKIQAQKDFLNNKLAAFGFKEGELKDLGFNIESRVASKKEGGSYGSANAIDHSAVMKQVKESGLSREEKIKRLRGQ